MVPTKELHPEFLMHRENSTTPPSKPLIQHRLSAPSVLQQVVAASSAAMITSLVVNPLDVIKTRLQTQTNPILLKTIQSTYMENGIRSFYKGLTASLSMQLPSSGIYYTVFDNMKSVIASKSPTTSSWLVSFYASFVSRIITTMVTTPFEYVRTAKQASTHPLTLRDLILDSHQRISVQKLWQGTTITLLRDVPFSTLYWTLFDVLSTRLHHVPFLQQHSLTQNFISGFCAGSLAAAVTTPMDVIKSNIQQLNGKNRIHFVARQIYEQEGMSGFFKGITPRVVRAAPSCAIMISTYELLKQF